MKRFILITILFTSCSVFRHKTENSSRQKDLSVHVTQQKDSLQLTAEARRIRFLSDDRLEITEIIPQGKFIYKPGSGFEGEAGRVRLYRRHQQRAVERDTSALSLFGSRDSMEVDSTLHEQAQRQLEEIKKSKPVPVWMYVLAAVFLLTGWICWKR